MRRTSEEAEQLHEQIWSHAIALSAERQRAEMVLLFIESMNKVIDLSEKRATVISDHVPSTVFLIIYTVAVIGFGFIGYSAGFSGHRHLFVTLLVVILISVLVTLIADLDPDRGVGWSK